MRFRTAILTILLLIPSPVGHGAEVDDLAKKLRHFDYKERLRAVDGLAEIGGPEAAKRLVGALEDEDWEVQIRALGALGRLKQPGTEEAIARAAVEGEIILVRQAAVEAIAAFDDPGIYGRILAVVARDRAETPKIRALEAAETLARPSHIDAIAPFTANREEKVRATAYRAAGSTGNPEALKLLLRGIRDKQIDVRVGAMIGLGGVGGPEAMEAIAAMVLTDRDPYVLNRASRVFRRFDGKAASEFLAKAASERRRPEEKARLVALLAGLRHEEAGRALVPFLAAPEPEVRAWAARGIGRSGWAEGAAKLGEPLESDPDDTVRRMALEGMANLLPEPERIGLLSRSMKNEAAEIRIRACVLLAREKGQAAIRSVYPLVAEPGWLVPTAAIITVGRLGHKEEVPVLAARAEDPDWKVRAAVMEGLGQLRAWDAVPYLIDAVDDRDPIVKSAAIKNLTILAQQNLGEDQAGWRKWYEETKDAVELTKKGYREEVEDDRYGTSKYLIEILNKAQIVCVLGKWDHSEIVLEHLGIKQTIIRPQDITDIGLNPKQLLLLNCEGTIGKKEAIERLQWFAHVGGYVMATDWALTNAVVRAYPGYVDMDSKSKTGNDVVEIEAADPDHPMLRGVFDRTTKLRWWLEVIAFPMKVVDPFRTDVLVDSLEMLEKYNASTMAAVFDYGHGKVEHCVSHFYLQEEGLASLSTREQRMIFAVDSLGISLDQVRQLDSNEFFDGQITEALTKEIAEDYSMFKLIVNFVIEKRKQVEQD